MEFSPTSLAISASVSGVTIKPQLLMTCEAFSTVVPISAAGEFMAK